MNSTITDELLTCETCQGNGEIVTDWDRYLKAWPGDEGDEAVAECPACDGIGWIDEVAPTPPTVNSNGGES